MFITALVTLALQARADDDVSTALQQTQAMMTDRKAVEAYAKDHPEAKAADDQITTLTGGNAQDTADVYKLASQIMGSMVTTSGGDPAKMQAELMKALQNPQSFAAKLTPEQQAQLKSLAGRIDSRAPTSAPH